MRQPPTAADAGDCDAERDGVCVVDRVVSAVCVCPAADGDVLRLAAGPDDGGSDDGVAVADAVAVTVRVCVAGAGVVLVVGATAEDESALSALVDDEQPVTRPATASATKKPVTNGRRRGGALTAGPVTRSDSLVIARALAEQGAPDTARLSDSRRTESGARPRHPEGLELALH